MNVLFVGLGSIGTRHLNNLAEVCARRGIELKADALRSSLRPLPGDAAQKLRAQYVSFDQLGHYDAAFITPPICTPTPLPSWRARRTAFSLKSQSLRGPATTWNSWALARGKRRMWPRPCAGAGSTWR